MGGNRKQGRQSDRGTEPQPAAPKPSNDELATRMAAHLATIIESSQDAIFSRAVDGTILSWNAGAERLYGYRAEEMIGSSVSVLIPPGGSASR